jgi:predicted RNA-binding protein YlxR (DUF448 family)
VAKKTSTKRKHVPQRTCVGCREVQAKRSMTRIVRTTAGVKIDLTGKLAGRGAYLHNLHECWESGLKGSIENALKIKLSPNDQKLLENFMRSLPKDS